MAFLNNVLTLTLNNHHHTISASFSATCHRCLSKIVVCIVLTRNPYITFASIGHKKQWLRNLSRNYERYGEILRPGMFQNGIWMNSTISYNVWMNVFSFLFELGRQ